MKIISWNVAGVNACLKKGLGDVMKQANAEIYCFQEMKATKEKMPSLCEHLEGYSEYHAIGEKKGYSGVSVYTRIHPISVQEGMGKEVFDREGRVFVLEFKNFFLINAYFPHAHRELKRLDFKLKFNDALLELCKKLEHTKPVIIAADFNVAHTALDLKNAKQNEKNAGFTIEERTWFDTFLKAGFIDTFRQFTSEGGHYTWWTYRNNARERNIGWRVDYFAASETLKKKLVNSTILKDVYGSDHCPIMLEMDL